MRNMMKALAAVAVVAFVSGMTARAQEPRTVSINGFDMAYREAGAGEPLVLLHGFGSCGLQSWRPFMDELSIHYRLIIPDLRGHGLSTNPGGAFTHRQAARDVLALLDHLDVDRFRAIGISTGGMTLLHVATSEPSRVQAMVLVGTTTYFPDQARAALRTLPEAPFYSEIQEMYAECAARGRGQTDSLLATFVGFQHSHDDMTFRPPQLATITARTLVIHGDRDEFFPVDIPVELYEAVPASELWIIPGGGHVPIYDPAVPFVATALRFLADTGG